MTAQIDDKCFHLEKEYRIVALSASLPFQPQEYGLMPHPSSTACYRGYWCSYVIDGGKLYLKDLFLFNVDKNYPSFQGVEVSPQEFREYTYHDMDGKARKELYPKYDGHRVYRNVNMPIPYTGKILLGNGFLDEYYSHMGHQQGWAYQELVELVFDEGQLIECYDLSQIAEEKRQAMKQQPDEDEVDIWQMDDDELDQYIQKCIQTPVEDPFSLDYTDKAWWLKE